MLPAAYTVKERGKVKSPLLVFFCLLRVFLKEPLLLLSVNRPDQKLLATSNKMVWDSSNLVKVTVKGKGEMVTFWVEDKANRTPPMEDELKVLN